MPGFVLQPSYSCFFITLSDEAGKKLDGSYAAFGLVTEGWDTVERIAALPLKPVPNDDGGEINKPASPVYLDRVTVQTWGKEYPFAVLEETENKPE